MQGEKYGEQDKKIGKNMILMLEMILVSLLPLGIFALCFLRVLSWSMIKEVFYIILFMAIIAMVLLVFVTHHRKKRLNKIISSKNVSEIENKILVMSMDEIINLNGKAHAYLHRVKVNTMVAFVLGAIVTAVISSVNIGELFTQSNEKIIAFSIVLIPVIFIGMSFLYIFEDMSWDLNSEGVDYYVKYAYELTTKIIDEREKVISNNFLNGKIADADKKTGK